MARFLTTTDISSQLEDIIKSARKYIVLISPYLQVNDRLREFLEEKDRFNRSLPDEGDDSNLIARVGGIFRPSKIDIHIVYGKSELQRAENEWLEPLTSIKTSFRRNLHAKCYLNEDKALLTSMNLYEFSQVNNDEMGILVLRAGDDAGLYRNIYNEAMRLASTGETRDKPESERAPRTAEKPKNGFCIRCRDAIPANPDRPYCERCFRNWNRFKNDEYEEKHCHTCGKGHKTNMAKPRCLTCYRAQTK